MKATKVHCLFQPKPCSQRLAPFGLREGLSSLVLPVPCIRKLTSLTMCHYRFYIYLGCGHSTFSPKPVSYCAKATTITEGKAQKDASPRQPPTELRNASPEVPLDLNEELRPEGAKPPPHRSLLTAPQSPKDKNTTRPPKRRRSPTPTRTTKLEPCNEGLIHPLHTVRIETLCPGCADDRERRLEALAMFSTEIKFDPARWQWKYRASGGGPSTKRQHVDDHVEPAIVGGDAGEAQKGEGGGGRGVWPGAKWMKDWRA